MNAAALRLSSVAGWTGRHSLRAGAYVLDLVVFVGHALRDWFARGHLRNRATRRSLVAQVLFTGIDALPLILLLALAVGLTFAAPFILLSRNLDEAELAPLLVRIVGVELGPLLTAIILIGRSGSAIAVDLANMKLHGEVAALEHLGINLNDFFVAPRLLGAAVAQLVLATYFTAIALFGGMLLANLLFAAGDGSLPLATAKAVTVGSVAVFTAKNLLFGLIIAGCACFSALRVQRSPTEVPQRTQQAIVSSQLLVFFLNGVIAVVTL